MLKKPNVIIAILSAVLLILIARYFFVNREAIFVLSSQLSGKEEVGKAYRVIIDPGHGGVDPGKVAASGAHEKDINLKIAQKLKTFLEAQDVYVVMTRETDEGLYSPGASNKKVEDMKNRLVLIESAGADVAVSIHQNSYHQEAIHGAQVFYYTSSKAGKKLSEIIQARLIAGVDPDNRRQAKGNDSYYLLKKTTIPLAIIECGFLSNAAEAGKLSDDYYQEKLAWAIHLGIMQYLNQVTIQGKP
ncbi:MAG: N-acetylmuramoyl-L-alanine amidase [Lachnospiraceae bacterium]|nr:N-acetylmuramoyl-L-alanine amidase [Lachnospiraceae bacterium]